jgi:hypothetical protein
MSRAGSTLLVLFCLLALVAPEAADALPDSRGWELVSPVDKGGGGVAAPEALFGGGVLQAAAQGGAVTYGSATSFGSAQGAPGASQYLSTRGPGGWSTENVTVPLVSGGYDTSAGAGVPYRLFSADLQGALISNGRRCRGDASVCPVANPPLPGSGASAGYQNYYRRGFSVAFEPLLRAGDLVGIKPQNFEVGLAGATADLSQVVLSSCSALTVDANVVPGSAGECDPTAQNLYRRNSEGLSLVNVLPGQAEGTPGAKLAAEGAAGALSAARAFFYLAGNLYLREGGQTVQVDESVAGGGIFELASADGSISYFSKEGHLYRYEAAAGTVSDLTPGGGVVGVLGGSADGAAVYYLTTAGIFVRHGAATTLIVPGATAAMAADYPPATGVARVSADGTTLVFLSAGALTGFNPGGAAEVYLYSTSSGLRCISCNGSGTKPLGPASIPGAVANGSLRVYKPRALSDSGGRLFFDTEDSLVAADVDKVSDVYQWEAAGTGSCVAPGGCVELISGGHSPAGATFLDASADGDDVFFVTEDSLVPADPSSMDVYDARVGGGFPVSEKQISCIGDACQLVPGVAEDPTPATIFSRSYGNPPLSPPTAKKKKKKPQHKKHHHRKHRQQRDKPHGGSAR